MTEPASASVWIGLTVFATMLVIFFLCMPLSVLEYVLTSKFNSLAFDIGPTVMLESVPPFATTGLEVGRVHYTKTGKFKLTSQGEILFFGRFRILGGAKTSWVIKGRLIREHEVMRLEGRAPLAPTIAVAAGALAVLALASGIALGTGPTGERLAFAGVGVACVLLSWWVYRFGVLVGKENAKAIISEIAEFGRNMQSIRA